MLVIAVPAHPGAVIGAPYPGVINDGVVAVDAQIHLGATHAGAADAEEDVVKADGILGVAGFAAFGPNFQQHRRLGFTRIEEQSGDLNAIRVRSRHRRGAMGGSKRGEAQAHHHGVGPRDANRFGQVVDAGSEQQILAAVQLRVDGGCGVHAGLRDVEPAERNRFPGC